MSRNVAAWASGIWLAGAGWAAGEGPPPLTPPALTPPVLTAPAESPQPAAPAAPIPESRPVLVVPGVTAPARPRPRVQLPAVESQAVDLGAPRELPSLDIPKEMLEPAPGAMSREIPSRTELPPVLESVPRGSPEDVRPSLSPRPFGSPAPTPGRRIARTPSSSPPPAPDAPRRATSFLGRLFPAPAPAPRSGPADRPSITVEPRSDPAADAALQRRIERQVRDAVGDRARSYEVRVIDRDVTVHVRAARFWQKRGVRHSLESLPALSGYHAKVEVVD